uniref:EF-hand domain-containing protein n=1 Tax=Tetranychus urticae TaxID=32264 RepID=T1KV89_TETUR
MRTFGMCFWNKRRQLMQYELMVDRLSKQQIADIWEAFKLFDKDCDGKITSMELGAVMKTFGLNPTDSEIEDIINEFDVHNDKFIDFNSFLTMMSAKMKDTVLEKEISEAFRIFDKDCDGFISTEEFRDAMDKLGEKFTDTEANQILQAIDIDCDGRISYEGKFLFILH